MDDKTRLKMEEVSQKSQEEQANFFLRAFGRHISPLEVAEIAKRFDAISGKEKAHEIEEPQVLKLLTDESKTMTRTEFREEFRKIDTDCNGRVSLIEFLLFKYEKQPRELFQDRGETDLVAQLDKAQQLEEELQALILERENKIHALKVKSNQQGVSGMRAKHELETLLASDESAIKEKEMRIKTIKARAEKACLLNDPFEAQNRARRDEEEKLREADRQSRQVASERLRKRGSAFGL